jgi:hypothetical protein
LFRIPSLPSTVIDGHDPSERLDRPEVPQVVHRAPRDSASGAPLVEIGPVGAILTRIGPNRLEQLQKRVAGHLAGLIQYVPETAPHVRDCLKRWRLRYEGPVDRGALNEHDALMLDGGCRILKRLLCNLDKLKSDQSAVLLKGYEARFQSEFRSESKSRAVGSEFGIVLTLAHLMVDTERAVSGVEGNPRWNERVARLSPWIGPPAAIPTGAVEARLKYLGLGAPKPPTELQDRRSIEFDPKDAIHMNAHWKICLRGDPDPEDEPLLTDIGNADLARALDGLLACCHGLGGVESRPLNVFADRWLGRLRTGEEDDPVARLQTLGVVAMRDAARRLGRPQTDSIGNRQEKCDLLAQLLHELALSADPVATLSHFVPYEVPTDPRMARGEHFDAVRRVVIDRSIRKAASLPPETLASPELNLRISKQRGILQQRLGVPAAPADPPPEDCGLFDASPKSLARLNHRICGTVNWRARKLNAAMLETAAARAHPAAPRPEPAPSAPHCSSGGTNLSVAASSGAVKRSIQFSPSHHTLAATAKKARRNAP